MVRIVTVFWASCSIALIATIAPHTADPNLPIGPAFLVGIAAAFYAGGVGAFAALKKRKLGVGIQGMVVGSAGSVVLESFIMGYINEALEPSTVEFLLPWIQLAFRMFCGGLVVKAFLKFADARDIASTVVSGAVGSLQVFCSFGFAFTEPLSIGKISSGEFGCTDWGCYLTLVMFMFFMVGGAFSQLKQFAVEKAQEAGEFEPKGRMDKISDFMNDKLKILMEVNQTLLDASEGHTPEELAELAKKHLLMVMQCAQIFAYTVCCMSGLTVAMEMVELLFSSGMPTGFLSWVTLLVFACGVLTTVAGVYGFRSFKLPAEEDALKRDLMERGLYLCILVVPLALILMVVFATTIHSDFVRAYLDLEGLEGNLEGVPGAESIELDLAGLPFVDNGNLTDAQLANNTALMDGILQEETFSLSDLLTLLTISLSYLVASLIFGIVIMSKALGGWLFIAVKVSAFFTYVVLGYGFLVATAGYHLDSADFMQSVNDTKSGKFIVNPYTLLMAVGSWMMLQALVGLLGLKLGKKGKILVKFYTLTLYLTLFANFFTIALGASLAAQTESTGSFRLIQDEDFEPAKCFALPPETDFDRNNNGVIDTVVGDCPQDFRGAVLIDEHQEYCEAFGTVDMCIFRKQGRLYGKFGPDMNKDEMTELIRESWRVLLVIGLVVCGILFVAVAGSGYVGKHVGDGDCLHSK